MIDQRIDESFVQTAGPGERRQTKTFRYTIDPIKLVENNIVYQTRSSFRLSFKQEIRMEIMRKQIKLTFVITFALIVLLVGFGGAAAGPAERNWLSVFTYDVPDGTWAEGPHAYTIRFDIPESTPGVLETSGAFLVSTTAPIYPDSVLLRGFSVEALVSFSPDLECTNIDTINPDQKTRFHIGWFTEFPLTHADAQVLFDNMIVTAEWDGGAPVPLVHHELIPVNERTIAKWPQYKCLWTLK
jgi:hypothetical protein